MLPSPDVLRTRISGRDHMRADPQGTREIRLIQNFFEDVKRLAPVR